MNDGAVKGVSGAERDLLRKSVRDLLAKHWPPERAVENCGDAGALAKLWREMAKLGLASLGAESDAGLREIVTVFEELGRAACPAPLLGAVAANFALAANSSNMARSLLEDLHHGDALIALALGGLDGDAGAGRVNVNGDALSGKLAFVEAAQAATHILVFVEKPSAVAIVARDAAGLKMQPTPGLAVPPLAELRFDDAPASLVGVASDLLYDIALTARLACAGRALGAAQRAFDLAVEHAKVRKQFGQLVGQFQAVQHKLADGLTKLDGSRLALEAAAQAYDDGNPDWRVFVASALAFAGPALREVSIQTHRALGAIGYAEEHEAPRHFRRVHADLTRFGGTPRARAELAEYLLGPVQ
jgi:acyl-CoA dehydrogenase